uniref:Uncharacterized protein n=1 Tax=Strongyloides venezuelensis TaxID=75913 RepID=A0A0K0FD29_STRVS
MNFKVFLVLACLFVTSRAFIYYPYYYYYPTYSYEYAYPLSGFYPFYYSYAFGYGSNQNKRMEGNEPSPPTSSILTNNI